MDVQYDDSREEVARANALGGNPIHSFDDVDLMNELDEAAALSKALDLVIAPGTSVTDIAGAIGAPVWTFILEGHFDTFGTGRLPWYPSARLFTRPFGEDLGGVLPEIRDALADFCAAYDASAYDSSAQPWKGC